MSSPTSDLGHPLLDVPIADAVPRGLATVPAGVRMAFIGLLVVAIFPPFVPLAGPLSLDDLFPLLAAAIGLPVLFLRRRPAVFDATVFGFALFGVVAIVSSAANANHLSEFLRFAGRSAGRMTFYLCLVLAVRATVGDGKWPYYALMLFVGAATAESLFCVYAYFAKYSGPYGMGVTGFAHWSVLQGKTRVQGTFGGKPGAFEVVISSANFLAAYLLLSIPVSAGLAIYVKRRRWVLLFAATTLLQIAVLYLTYTRAALIALGCSILAMGWLLGRRKLAALVLIAGIVGAMSVPTIRRKFLFEKHDRFALYYAAASIVADNPITGIGDGVYLHELHDNQRYFWNRFGSATTTSHNSVLLSAAHHGVLGGLAHAMIYFFLLLACVRAVGRSKGRARALSAGVAAALVGYLVQDQFNDLAYVPKVATQAWFLFGVLWMLPALGNAESGEESATTTDDDAADREQGAETSLRRVGNG